MHPSTGARRFDNSPAHLAAELDASLARIEKHLPVDWAHGDRYSDAQ